MNIDLTELMTNIKDVIGIDVVVDFDEEMLSISSIRKLLNTKFVGEVSRISDTDYQLSGSLDGTMVLPDDITLDDVNYDFSINVDEEFNDNIGDNNLVIIKNKLDISEFLWQNILVEIPLKVVKKENENLTMEGNGWRLTTEEELEKENDSSPFDALLDMFDDERSD